MNAFDLNYLFKRHGLITVWDIVGYHGFRPEDIDGEKIKDGACPVASFSVYTLCNLPTEKGNEFIEMCKRAANYYRYDASQLYIVCPIEKEEQRKHRPWKPRSPAEIVKLFSEWVI